MGEGGDYTMGGSEKSPSVWQAFTTFAFIIIIMSVYLSHRLVVYNSISATRQ